MPHFMIVSLSYNNLLNLSWIKNSIFEENGALKQKKYIQQQQKINTQHLGKKIQQILKYFSCFPRKLVLSFDANDLPRRQSA